MKEKINQKGFIQIPLLIVIIASIFVMSAGTAVVLYRQGKLAPFVANISQVFKEVKDLEPEAESLEAEKIKQEAEKSKAEAEELKREAEEAKRKDEEEARIKTEQELQQKTMTVEEIKEKKLITDDIATISIKEYLEKQGLIDVTIEIVNKKNEGGVKTLTLRYKSTAYQGIDEFSLYGGYTIGKRLVAEDMSKIMFVFTNIIDLGWDIDELVVVFSDITTGTVKGTWYCNRTWIDDYLGKIMSMEGLNSVVKGTIMFF